MKKWNGKLIDFFFVACFTIIDSVFFGFTPLQRWRVPLQSRRSPHGADAEGSRVKCTQRPATLILIAQPHAYTFSPGLFFSLFFVFQRASNFWALVRLHLQLLLFSLYAGSPRKHILLHPFTSSCATLKCFEVLHLLSTPLILNYCRWIFSTYVLTIYENISKVTIDKICSNIIFSFELSWIEYKF